MKAGVDAQSVSVCIPARNGARWIEATIRSALADDTVGEVVVSDDASTDNTASIAASIDDPRVRIERSERRLGMAGNWNHAAELSGGTYLKVLMQDDVLLPGALGRQVALLDRHPSAGLAFGTRELVSDGSQASDRWIRRFGRLHDRLPLQHELVVGTAIVDAVTKGRLRGNAIGEPSVVLLRRSAFAKAGGFNTRMRQLTDLDLWLRIAQRWDVAFDPAPVVRFLVHQESTTARNRRTGDAWLDRFLLLDGISEASVTRIGLTHYGAATIGSAREIVPPLIRRRRSLARTVRELRTYLVERRRPSPSR